MTVRGRESSAFFLIGAVMPDQLRQLVRFLHEDVPENAACVDVLIESEGGSVAVALAMARLLKALPCPVRTWNLSNVDSAAIVVFAAGIDRFCAPGGGFFFHPVGREVVGAKTAEEFRKIADEIDSDERQVAEFMAESTGSSAETWQVLMRTSRTMSAEEAMATGLAVGIRRPENFFKLKNGKDIPK